jgi:hypothetical protein
MVSDSEILLDSVKAIQLTTRMCRITFKKEKDKDKFLEVGMSVRGKTITFINPHVDITNLTIKDLPVECSDEFVAGHLLKFGRIVNGSMVHGVIKGTSIKTGTN